MTIALNEEFDSPTGQWHNYDAYDPLLRADIRTQKHIDIRDMRIADITAIRNVLELSSQTVSSLNGQTVSALSTLPHPIKTGEHWSAGTNVSLADHNYWQVLQVATTGSGTMLIDSVIDPIDLLTGFASDDIISMALPSFPASGINTALCWVVLTSDPNGNFNTGHNSSVRFADSLTSITSGDCEFRALRSSFDNGLVDLSAVTGVRFQLSSSLVVTVNFAALRLLSKTWQ